MSSIGWPDWGASYRFPVNPSQCVVFSQARNDGATGATTIYTLAAGEVVVVAAMSVGINYSIVGDAVPFSGVAVTKSIDGAGALQQLIIAEIASNSIDLHQYNQGLATDTALDAPIAIFGGAAGNVIEWNFSLYGTASIVAYANVILYKTA
jgi:hypothetical protein